MRHLIFSLLFLLAFALIEVKAHDMPIAFFNLMIEEEGVGLTIMLDKTDFEATLKPRASGALSPGEIETYLYENMTWFFDGERADIDICTIEQVQDHYQIKARFAESAPSFSGVKVINTCLVDSIEKHSNVLNVEYAGKKRAFRLHKDRTQTVFDLD